jgi:hypothetical protein
MMRDCRSRSRRIALALGEVGDRTDVAAHLAGVG